MANTSVKLTKKTKAFVDISLAFEPSPVTSDLTLLTNERAINNSVKNLIRTIPTEVPFDHLIGSQVSGYLFELVDQATASLVELEVQRVLEFNEPRIELQSVYAEPNLVNNSYELTISYKIVGYDQIIEVKDILTPTK